MEPGQVKHEHLHSLPVKYTDFRLADSMKHQENWQLSLSSDSIYPTRKYNKFTHLLNIHSWAPLYIDLNGMDVNLGAVIYSQNKLSSAIF